MSDEEKKEINWFFNNNLPSLFVDNLVISTRTDGLHFLRLFHSQPEGLQEQARITIPPRGLLSFIDVLCRHTGHYPEKAKEAKKRAQETESKKPSKKKRPRN